MPTVRTNLLRMEFNPSHFLYQLEITSKSSIENHFLLQIQQYIAQIIPHALFNYPHIYSPKAITETILYTHLSNGSSVMLQLTQFPSNTSNPALAPLITNKLMSFTNMLFSDIFSAYFNPFQEKVDHDKKIIVGWKIGTERNETVNMLRVQALQLILSSPGILGEQSEVLIDYDTGNFLLKQNIVRIDKNKGQVLFRNGELCRRDSLYSASIIPLNGYPLANNIDNLLGRIKEISTDFSKQWSLKFDSRLVEVSGTYSSVGVLGFRQNIERGTSELVSPMNELNYENNLIHLFSGILFDDILKANLVYLVENDKQDYIISLKKQIQKISSRMNLEINSKIVIYNGLNHLQQLLTVLHNQPCQPHINRIYFIQYSAHKKQKIQHENLQHLVQFLINNAIPYHLLEVNIKKQYNFQTLAYHHLPIIYTKCRLNPWKLKNIPFLSQPMMLVALHIQLTRQKLYSVAIVATMNVFFTKFTATHKIATKDTINQAVQKGLLQCLQIFKSKHQRYPNRVFLIRTGSGAQDDLNLQKGKAELRLRGAQLTYVTLFNGHGIRMFNQLDSNYVSKQSVKKIQLFLYATINKELYYQIQLERPAHRVRIYEIQQNDPNFVQKILQLISRVILGGVGNSYGKGLGILDYPKKLNHYRQYNLMPWQSFLTDGILIFL